MKVITEGDIREFLKKDGQVVQYIVPPGSILTPAAKSYLLENKIEIVNPKKESVEYINSGDESKASEDIEYNITSKNEPQPKPDTKNNGRIYHILATGEDTTDKPEAFTHLYDDNLVPKIHPRIKFRGRVDAMESKIIMAQVLFKKAGFDNICKDLGDILTAVQKIMRAEVLSEPLEPIEIFGLSESEIRFISHNPAKTIGVKHFLPAYDQGEYMSILNFLRTEMRQLEISACDAFYDPFGGLEREDIIKMLNRLSSALYIMMCWVKAGKYANTGA